jgi:ABC-type nickel/cobalt efflux system permease component RcnA
MLTVISGALAGAFHVLSGPDHLAAVAPLAANAPRRAWLAGGTWGVGHAAGVVVVAALAVLLRDSFPPIDSLSAWSERLVGGVLIALGLWGLRQSLRVRPAVHVHGERTHDHLHVQAGPAWARRLGHAHAAFCVGVLHGIAGTSHFLGVLPALALPTRMAALTYVGAFGVGTVMAMAAFAAVVGAAGTSAPRASRMLRLASAAAAVLVGGFWLVG